MIDRNAILSHQCAECGKRYYARRADAQTCSGACRQRVCRRVHRAASAMMKACLKCRRLLSSASRSACSDHADTFHMACLPAFKSGRRMVNGKEDRLS